MQHLATLVFTRENRLPQSLNNEQSVSIFIQSLKKGQKTFSYAMATAKKYFFSGDKKMSNE
jgi:hypothetical protein